MPDFIKIRRGGYRGLQAGEEPRERTQGAFFTNVMVK